ncbi:replication fork protection component Swi3-domain-containing protein [Astrocystis sublimbata]|nr:replication fork protection component Swi3-domain-containing protein [Astrocystis sublimbata]
MANALDNYDVEDDPFASSGDEAAPKNGHTDSQSKKRKDASGLGLGIDEAVSVTKKPRVPRVKLDENRLLSENGIPKLRSKAQNLKFKGKGHEFSDASRLLSFYQLWLDDLFPKAKFVDALSMVEKAGHKNQIRLKRIQWIDEGRPKPAGFEDDNDNDDDLFGDANQPQERDAALFPARVAPIFQHSLDRAAKTPAVDDDPFGDDDIYGTSPTRKANAASAANGADEPDEDELDALMAEDEAQRTINTTTTTTTPPTSLFGNGKPTQPIVTRRVPDEDDNNNDDDLDALMAEAEAEPTFTKTAKPISHRPARKPGFIDDDDDDEGDDLDALMAEAEAEAQGSSGDKAPPPKTAAPKADEGTTGARDVDEEEEAAMAEMEGLW